MNKLSVLFVCVVMVVGLAVQPTESHASAIIGVSSGGTVSASPITYSGIIPAVSAVPISNNVFPVGINAPTSAIAILTVSDATTTPSDGVATAPSATWAITNTGPIAIGAVTFTLTPQIPLVFPQVVAFGAIAAGPGTYSGSAVGSSMITYTGDTIAPGETKTFGFVLSVPVPPPGQTTGIDILQMSSSAVPEPSSWALGGLGVAMIAGFGWRRRREKKDVTQESA